MLIGPTDVAKALHSTLNIYQWPEEAVMELYRPRLCTALCE